MNKPKILSIITQLPSLDFEVSKQFYIEIFDCKLIDEFDDLLIFLMDDIELHLWKCEDKAIPENSSCYIHVDDIEGVFNYYQEKLQGKLELFNRPWGMREFYIIDPSGNLFKFGKSIEG